MSRDDGKLKAKARLRAEAVERLNVLGKYLQASDIQWGLFGSGKDNMSPDKLRDELVSLLTDDAHESRGSYEERLYDVLVSECPYCGCERVVIHDFNDMYEKPHSYRVEHIDEKEAFNAGCFESYYAFDSVEKAVEHANMRDLLTDEEPRKFGVTAEQMAKASADFFNKLPSVNGKNGDSLPTTAEDEDSNCKKDDSLQDSREKLEAEIRYEYNGNIKWEADQIIEWLDRQAAIDRREFQTILEEIQKCMRNGNL